MKTYPAIAAYVLLSSCGNGTPSLVTPPASSPPSGSGSPAISSGAVGGGGPVGLSTTPTPTVSAYEGIWSGTGTYPAFIVDADGYYWSETDTWDEAIFSYMSGQIISSTSMTVTEGAIIDGEGSFQDELTVTSIVASNGSLTLEGTLFGAMQPQGDDTYDQTGIMDALYPYSNQLALEPRTVTPDVTALTGSYVTLWSGTLQINPDGTFVLNDDGHFGFNGGSGCTYTGSIAIKDPATNVYSITGTANALWLAAPTSITGVFTVSASGALQGGMTDGAGCSTTVDTQ